ncbi:MAG: MEDS domain-containing protein [Nitrosopumilaceae archaeon]
MHNLSPIPFKYIDSLESKQHIALFYEESEYARLIEFRFIKHGLEIGEHCVYATEEDSGSIVLKMINYGIPLSYFQSGRLKVYQIQRTCGGRDEIMKRCKRDIDMIFSNLISPFRIVSRIVQDVSTPDGMSVELELECTVHDKFEDFGGSLICPYDISKIEPSKRKQWFEHLRANHHAVIYAPRFGEGGVFCAM